MGDLSGKYFDQDPTWSLLSGSRDGDKLVAASFDSDGHLFAGWNLYPDIPIQSGGYRLEEVRNKT